MDVTKHGSATSLRQRVAGVGTLLLSFAAFLVVLIALITQNWLARHDAVPVTPNSLFFGLWRLCSAPPTSRGESLTSFPSCVAFANRQEIEDQFGMSIVGSGLNALRATAACCVLSLLSGVVGFCMLLHGGLMDSVRSRRISYWLHAFAAIILLCGVFAFSSVASSSSFVMEGRGLTGKNGTLSWSFALAIIAFALFAFVAATLFWLDRRHPEDLVLLSALVQVDYLVLKIILLFQLITGCIGNIAADPLFTYHLFVLSVVVWSLYDPPNGSDTGMQPFALYLYALSNLLDILVSGLFAHDVIQHGAAEDRLNLALNIVALVTKPVATFLLFRRFRASRAGYQLIGDGESGAPLASSGGSATASSSLQPAGGAPVLAGGSPLSSGAANKSITSVATPTGADVRTTKEHLAKGGASATGTDAPVDGSAAASPAKAARKSRRPKTSSPLSSAETAGVTVESDATTQGSVMPANEPTVSSEVGEWQVLDLSPEPVVSAPIPSPSRPSTTDLLSGSTVPGVGPGSASASLEDAWARSSRPKPAVVPPSPPTPLVPPVSTTTAGAMTVPPLQPNPRERHPSLHDALPAAEEPALLSIHDRIFTDADAIFDGSPTQTMGVRAKPDSEKGDKQAQRAARKAEKLREEEERRREEAVALEAEQVRRARMRRGQTKEDMKTPVGMGEKAFLSERLPEVCPDTKL